MIYLSTDNDYLSYDHSYLHTIQKDLHRILSYIHFDKDPLLLLKNSALYLDLGIRDRCWLPIFTKRQRFGDFLIFRSSKTQKKPYRPGRYSFFRIYLKRSVLVLHIRFGFHFGVGSFLFCYRSLSFFGGFLLSFRFLLGSSLLVIESFF